MNDKSSQENIFDELAEKWLSKAKEDLLWAEASFKDDFYASACFVTQQVAEKSLKAYLFSKRQELIKTHVLPRLLKNCLKFNKDFEELKTACEILSLYYTEARYPDDVDTSAFDTKEKAKEAIDLAREVLDFIDKRI